MKSTKLMVIGGLLAIGTMFAATFVGTPPLFRSFQFGGKVLKATYANPNGEQYEISLKTDVADYRNGVSHKAWIKPEDYKFVVTPLNGANPAADGSITSCVGNSGQGLLGAGLKVVSAGSTPSVDCVVKFGNGASAPTVAVELN